MGVVEQVVRDRLRDEERVRRVDPGQERRAPVRAVAEDFMPPDLDRIGDPPTRDSDDAGQDSNCDLSRGNDRDDKRGDKGKSSRTVTPLRMSAAELLGPIAPREYVMPGIPVGAYSLGSGALSAGKTTWELTLAVSRASGFDLLGLTSGSETIEAGPVVVVIYEDSDQENQRRIQEVVQGQVDRMAQAGISQAERDRFVAMVAANLYRLTLTGDDSACIVIGTAAGPARNQGMLDDIVAGIRSTIPADSLERGVLICLDPLRLALRGLSQSDDLGADCVVGALNWLAVQIPHSAVFVLSHWTKGAATTTAGEVDAMTAAYGTSGSALYSQHARSNFTLHRLDADEARKAGAPGEVTAEDAQRRRVVRLTHGRLSTGEASAVRDYLHARAGLLVSLTRRRPLEGDALLIETLRAAAAVMGIRPASERMLLADDTTCTAAGGRNRLRDLLEKMKHAGLIEWTGKSSGKQAGGFQLTDLGSVTLQSGEVPAGRAAAQVAQTGGANA